MYIMPQRLPKQLAKTSALAAGQTLLLHMLPVTRGQDDGRHSACSASWLIYWAKAKSPEVHSCIRSTTDNSLHGKSGAAAGTVIEVVHKTPLKRCALQQPPPAAGKAG